MSKQKKIQLKKKKKKTKSIFQKTKIWQEMILFSRGGKKLEKSIKPGKKIKKIKLTN